jgi:hypothetical protein
MRQASPTQIHERVGGTILAAIATLGQLHALLTVAYPVQVTQPLRVCLNKVDVERTVSWWGQSRRLRKEYERLCTSSDAMIYATVSRLMVRRLAHC